MTPSRSMGLVLLGLAACRGAAAPSPSVRSISAPRLEVGVVDVETTALLGVVVPKHEVRLASEVGGRVEAVLARTGDRVAAGAIVVALETTEARSELRAARASERAADADTRRVELDARRSAEASERARGIADIVAQDELLALAHEERSSVLAGRSARAVRAERRARADGIAERIASAGIASPFAGTVVERHVEPGAFVAPGDALMHVISDERIVRFAAHEADVERLPVGRVVTMTIDGGGVLVGTVSAVSPEIDAATRVVMVEASVDTRLRVGTIVRVGSTR